MHARIHNVWHLGGRTKYTNGWNGIWHQWMWNVRIHKPEMWAVTYVGVCVHTVIDYNLNMCIHLWVIVTIWYGASLPGSLLCFTTVEVCIADSNIVADERNKQNRKKLLNCDIPQRSLSRWCLFVCWHPCECVHQSVWALSVHECASVTVHSLISQQKNRTWLVREQGERQREIRNPIQWRALVHCKCGRGHSQFQKEQVLYIRVWRDGRPSCSLL